MELQEQDKEQVLDTIIARIKKQGGGYPTWYCGIASDYEKRLFTDHQVPREEYWFVVCKCHNNNDARVVETALHELHCDGAPGGGDEATVHVYAYLKSAITNP